MKAETEGDAFRDWYLRTSPRVYAYLRRYCPVDECDDVMAEVYLIAWRRFTELPTDAVPWLIGTTRKVLANTRRSRGRRGNLTVALASLSELAGPDTAEVAVERTDLLRAMSQLPAKDQEVLLLAGWDGLDGLGIAEVLGCSQVAARARLSRARSRLARQLSPSSVTTPTDLLPESQLR